jgi:hypothetical protein
VVARRHDAVDRSTSARTAEEEARCVGGMEENEISWSRGFVSLREFFTGALFAGKPPACGEIIDRDGPARFGEGAGPVS